MYTGFKTRDTTTMTACTNERFAALRTQINKNPMGLRFRKSSRLCYLLSTVIVFYFYLAPPPPKAVNEVVLRNRCFRGVLALENRGVL